jgi:hypothetical protein
MRRSRQDGLILHNYNLILAYSNLQVTLSKLSRQVFIAATKPTQKLKIILVASKGKVSTY